MKEPSKHMLNGIIIVLVAIIIAITFTINYSSPNKDAEHCYKKLYAGKLSEYSEFYPALYKTKQELEGVAASEAFWRCYWNKQKK